MCRLREEGVSTLPLRLDVSDEQQAAEVIRKVVAQFGRLDVLINNAGTDVTLPHFDRWVRRMGDSTLRQLAASLPDGVALIGVDEDTALVNFDGCAAEEDSASVWQVLGRQGVSLIDAAHGETRFSAGKRIELGAASRTTSP